MSLILEALRKSEAERRRGSTPDVALELPPAVLARARATPAWLAPVVLFVMAAMVAAWWWQQRGAHPPAGNQVPTTAPSAAPSAAPSSPLPAPTVVVARPSPTRREASPPPPAATAPQAPANAPGSAAMPAPMPLPMPVPMQPPPLPAPAPAPAPVNSNVVPDIDATSLPPVKLSMHIWDASPGKRFVILDGQRMGEGDRNGEVTVVAIERDGVVVERMGQRALVPLP